VEWSVQSLCLCGGFDLCLARREGFLRRVGVDVVAVASLLPVPPDAEAEKVEALVDMHDPRLVDCQTQPDAGEDRRHLLPQALGLFPTAADHDHEVVAVPDQPVRRAAASSVVLAGGGVTVAPPNLGEVFVE